MTRRLGWILGCILLIGILATLAAGIIAGRRALAELDRSAAASATLHNAVFRSELEKFRLVPTALASDPEAVAALRGDASAITSFDRRLEQLSGSIRAAAIYLIDSRGRTVAASNWTLPTSFVGSNYGFRDYFRRALADGSFEQFALGTVSREPGLYLARRVSANGVRGVIVVKVEFTALEAEWAQSTEPAFVTDARGIVLVTSVPGWRFLTDGDLSPTERTTIRRNLDFGNAPLTPLPIAAHRSRHAAMVDVTISGGRPQTYLENEVPTAIHGWTLHVLTPVGTVVSNAATSARLATAMALALLMLGVWLIVRRQQRIRAREAAAIAAQATLEREVDARTRDLREANQRLQVEMHDRLASEARLQEARDQLVQANKLASLGQIAAGVAHEINQPVAAISSYAHSGRQYLDLSRTADAADSFESIAAMTDRIGSITGELRNFARKATGALGEVRLDDAIDGALLLLRDRIAREAVAIERPPGGDLLVRAERIRLEQVLVNLLGNALDALEDTPEPVISLAVAASSDIVDLDIANNGPMLPDAIAGSLFQPFNSSKEDGLGLGLVISRDIMTDFGGTLTHVPADHGVVFRVRLMRA
ncbi:sensor histidine kinase [Hephaestia mangrovi]|uniref:sensor histidine kinase n=1 Tax=Hephaestia mangrovi TaxID=2873268 RepID=UPI001CA600C7|nr:cache domain-containing protein [Hephaestia mangrovi]MBY8828581.1 sensor histidine kinase [Hephaestia mangrovi]